ncbi:unnamed protein product [Knipowitschia caucasica]
MEMSALLLLLLCPALALSQVDILPDGPLEELLGTDATFKTLLQNPKFAFIIWNFNNGKEQIHVSTLGSEGMKTNTPYEGRVDISTDGHLTLRKLTAADSGEYSINVISGSGATQTAEIDLKVIEPVAEVLVKSDLSQAVELNSTVVVTCSAKGSHLSFSWMNGTTAVKQDTHITVTTKESSSALSISSVYRTDLAGPLYCTVSNSKSTEKSEAFNLTVHYGPEQVTLSPPNPPAFVASGSNFSLTCAAVSSPMASITWLQGDVQMDVMGPVLTLDKLKTIDKASYSCKASNAQTKREVHSAAVSFTIIDPISGVKLSSPSGQLMAGNSSANISCAAAKGSVDSVSWLKNGAVLIPGGSVVFSADKSSVLINPLEKEDNGDYTCTMSNAVSSQSDKVKLSVIYGPEPVQLNGDSKVEVSDMVTLDCSAASVPPANYTWKFNDTKTAVTTSQYSIPKVTYSNTGTYTCEAFNALTGKTSSKSHFLVVRAEGELDEGLSDGAIAGIVIGVLAAVAIAVGLFIYCRQKLPLESPY